ncbi:hypothetical protein G3567_04065 [Psychroflexus sp. YR1-1]|uniref:Uncharacterized protein n=1 Tax=Psychroflexus aurantiacus TaxID=2709310 RepID=A0A6B3QYQ6_9FLAO|nr:hypothetical protein [Psychroflexus aurantiacus]NEV93326.1 hypothetical protein [Psychroflexus aurantiacus]
MAENRIECFLGIDREIMRVVACDVYAFGRRVYRQFSSGCIEMTLSRSGLDTFRFYSMRRNSPIVFVKVFVQVFVQVFVLNQQSPILTSFCHLNFFRKFSTKI